ILASRVGLLMLTRQAKHSGWVEFELDFMNQQRAAGRLKILAVELDLGCALPQGVHADEVLIPKSRTDVTKLVDLVEKAVTKALNRARAPTSE
ncbi:MAG: hypothetical protein NTY01_08140, partial [Verrucomicrobia bacterium]|nr:hypothetical protein [Verrucomicrobiota bacterium]